MFPSNRESQKKIAKNAEVPTANDEQLVVANDDLLANDSSKPIIQRGNPKPVTVRVIDLSNTAITDDGIEHVRNLPLLEKIAIYGTKVSPERWKN